MLGGSEWVLGGSEQVLGGSEQVLGGSEWVLGGSEQVLGGSEWVFHGIVFLVMFSIKLSLVDWSGLSILMFSFQRLALAVCANTN